jgi:hypothetical protein
MSKIILLFVLFQTLADLTTSARIKIDPVALGRQERRLEDSGLNLIKLFSYFSTK